MSSDQTISVGDGPVALTNSPKGKGKGVVAPPPPAPPSKGKGKGKTGRAASSNATAPSKPEQVMLKLVVRQMNGDEMEITAGSNETLDAVKLQISAMLGGVSRHRLKIAVGDEFVGGQATLAESQVKDGDVLSVIILSPLHGCLNRNGIEVPLDVMGVKLDVNEALHE